MTSSVTARALQQLGPPRICLGIEIPGRLLRRLGDPQDAVPVVLVAGTNGKGSTAALLASVLRATGLKVGLYTSPELEDIEETIRVDGRSIADTRLAALLTEVIAAGGNEPALQPTRFEALTAAAYCHFARELVDLAVVEVGLGGRLDATNVCEPVLSLVTSISRDHQEYLGTSLQDIAREKAGVFRPHRAALSWVQEAQVAAALRREADLVGARFIHGPQRVTIVRVTGDGSGSASQGVGLRTPRAEYSLALPLLGRHQVSNLALAVLAAETLAEERGYPLTRQAVESGVRRCRWPGRLERIPVPGARTVFLDGAHNEGGLKAILDFLATHPLDFDVLFGALDGKLVDSLLPSLTKAARGMTVTAPPTPRARSLASYGIGPGEWTLVEDWATALERSLEARHRPLLVCGSLALAGAVRTRLRQRFGVPRAAVEMETSPSR